MMLSTIRAFPNNTVCSLSQLIVEDESSVFYAIHTQISFLQEKQTQTKPWYFSHFSRLVFYYYYFFLSGLDTLHNLRCVHYLDALPWWKSLSISWMNLLFVDYVWTLPGPVDSLHCCNSGGCWEVDTGSLSAIGVHLPCSLCHWRERCKGAFAHSDNSDFNLKMISSYLEKMWRRMLNISRFPLLIEVQFNRNGWIILNSSEISFLSFLIHCVKQTFFLPNAGWILCHSTFWHNMES